MKQLQFYAAEGDLLPVLQAVESHGALKYIRFGNSTSRHVQAFSAGSELPNLGKATSESAISSESFLVCQCELDVVVDQFVNDHGVARCCIDQLANPDTVTLTPGGVWSQDVVLYGRVATASESKTSQELMRRFAGAIKKQFTKIKAFYVGPKARELLEAGKRLTIAAQSPREFDLKASDGTVREG
jgi:hypothetical protein